jgi:hypothetical protein
MVGDVIDRCWANTLAGLIVPSREYGIFEQLSDSKIDLARSDDVIYMGKDFPILRQYHRIFRSHNGLLYDEKFAVYLMFTAALHHMMLQKALTPRWGTP